MIEIAFHSVSNHMKPQSSWEHIKPTVNFFINITSRSKLLLCAHFLETGNNYFLARAHLCSLWNSTFWSIYRVSASRQQGHALSTRLWCQSHVWGSFVRRLQSEVTADVASPMKPNNWDCQNTHTRCGWQKSIRYCVFLPGCHFPRV